MPSSYHCVLVFADNFQPIFRFFWRERKKHIKKTNIKNFRGSQGGVQEGGFGARILYAGVIFPSKMQRVKSFKGVGGVSGFGGGGLRSNLGGHFFVFTCFFGT